MEQRDPRVLKQRSRFLQELFTPACWSSIQRQFDLTPRQLEICHFICEGYANKQIATALGISPHTVRMHVQGVFVNVGVGSRVELVLELVRAAMDGEGSRGSPWTDHGADALSVSAAGR